MKRTRYLLASALTLVLCASALHPGALATFSTLWQNASAGRAGMGPPAPRVSLESQGLIELRADRAKQASSFHFSPTLLARTVRPAPPAPAGRLLRDNESRSPLEGQTAIRLARAPPCFHS